MSRSTHQNKTVMLHFRVAEEEATLAKAAAERSGVSLSDWLRGCVATSLADTDPEMIEAQVKRARASATIAKGAKESWSGEAAPSSEEVDVDFERLVLRLRAQGRTKPVAIREAKQLLGR